MSDTSRMLPLSENLCWRSSSRWRTRLLSLRSCVRSSSTSSRTAADDDGDGNWWCRGDDEDSSPPPSDSGRSPDPGVSAAAADDSTPLELGPPGWHVELLTSRCPVSPSTASFCSKTVQTRRYWRTHRRRIPNPNPNPWPFEYNISRLRRSVEDCYCASLQVIPIRGFHFITSRKERCFKVAVPQLKGGGQQRPTFSDPLHMPTRYDPATKFCMIMKLTESFTRCFRMLCTKNY